MFWATELDFFCWRDKGIKPKLVSVVYCLSDTRPTFPAVQESRNGALVQKSLFTFYCMEC